MKKKIKANTELEEQAARDSHPGMTVTGTHNHIVGKDEVGEPVYERTVELSDEVPPGPGLGQRLDAFEARMEVLERHPALRTG